MNTCNTCGFTASTSVNIKQPKELPFSGEDWKCLIGIHKYRKVGHLYNNHFPPNIAIYEECTKCGKVNQNTIAMTSLDRVSECK
jgi:hypothetical protein